MNVSTLATWPFYLTLLLSLSGCQASYLLKGAVEQTKILRSRQPIGKVIENVATPEKVKEKLAYSQKAQKFAKDFGLNCKKNFQTYVQLNRPYVTYLLIASHKYEIKAKTWWFPIVGSFPYKGFFSETDAQNAAFRLEEKGYDTYTRGVSAYSSLGWFREPILSSMLHQNKHTLAETIFHECFHSTFFIKNNVALNEQLATFFGHKILIEFLKTNDHQNQIAIEKKSWQDQKIFSSFLEKTLKTADQMYSEKKTQKEVLAKIQRDYMSTLKPQLKVLNYDRFFMKNLNNAKLAARKTYFHKFEKLEEILKDKYEMNASLFLEDLKKAKNKKKLIKELGL